MFTACPSQQQATSSVHYTTSCKHSLALLRMGEIIARNMVICYEITNKLLLLLLVGYLYCLILTRIFHAFCPISIQFATEESPCSVAG